MGDIRGTFDASFGGIQLVVSGDFGQLLPVVGQDAPAVPGDPAPFVDWG